MNRLWGFGESLAAQRPPKHQLKTEARNPKNRDVQKSTSYLENYKITPDA
jgi:hypothetical protein